MDKKKTEKFIAACRQQRKSLILVMLLLVALFVVILVWQKYQNAQIPIAKHPVYHEEISPKINEYLVNDFQGILTKPEYDVNGNLTLGQPENYCKALVSDYDDEHIYAYVICQEYAWSYNYKLMQENTVKITRFAVHGTGWSSHVRFKYRPGTDFEIVGHDSPRGGATYHDDLIKLFGSFERIGEPDLGEREEIYEEILGRFRNRQSSWPEQNVKFRGVENPKVVIGGEIDERE